MCVKFLMFLGHSDKYSHYIPFINQEDERQIYTALKVGAKSQSGADILEGIRYASQVPMRAGAARSIVLITCDDCSTESKVSFEHSP